MSSDQAYRFEIVPPPGSLDSYFFGSETADLTGLKPIGRVRAGRVFATSALQAEVEALREVGGLSLDAVYHCTSSQALLKISEQRAIICSKEALRIYGEVNTGEIAQMRTPDWPQMGLEDVYAHRRISTSYFFGDSDRYPVIFGIRGVPIKDAFGDGLKLRPRVSLDNVVSVTVPHEQLPITRDWVAENCMPGTLAMSQYAASLLTNLRPDSNDAFVAKYID